MQGNKPGCKSYYTLSHLHIQRLGIEGSQLAPFARHGGYKNGAHCLHHQDIDDEATSAVALPIQAHGASFPDSL
jgi:hypothetical protein